MRLPVAMAGGMHAGARPALWFAELRDDVAAVELHFQDGSVDVEKPVEGYVLREIGAAHYAKGHRLDFVLARGADGRVLQREDAHPDTRGVYPCEKPDQLDYGVEMCP